MKGGNVNLMSDIRISIFDFEPRFNGSVSIGLEVEPNRPNRLHHLAVSSQPVYMLDRTMNRAIRPNSGHLY